MNEQPEGSPNPIVRADPRHRIVFAVLVLAILGVGLVLHLTLTPRLEAWADGFAAEIQGASLEELLQRYRLLSSLVAMGLALPLLLMGATFLYQGLRVRASNRYPYPGMIVLADTPLETGVAAGRRAVRMLVVGGALVILACVVGVSLYGLLMRLIL